MRGFDRPLRGAAALSTFWIAAVSAAALYERSVVDPWRFIGENRGAVFFTWSAQLVYDNSIFGDFVLVLDHGRFWTVLLLPVAALFAGAFLMRSLKRRRRGAASQD